MTLISTDNTWALWTVIAVCVALSIWLEKKFKWAAKISALVIVLLLGIILANINVIPTESPVYDTVWDYLVPLALPLLLFKVDLKKVCKESGQMLIAYLIGAVGSVVGAFVASFLFMKFIPELPGVAAMMTGTYIGGSINFMALSTVFDVSGETVSSATIADNLNMAIYFFVLLSIPVRNRMTNALEGKSISAVEAASAEKKSEQKKSIGLTDIAVCIALAFAIVTVSSIVANLIGNAIPESNVPLEMCHSFFGNKYLWITTISVILATVFRSFFSRIQGGQELGTYMIYCFMFVIGAPASIAGIIQKSPMLLVFAMTIVIFNMIFTFGGGKLFKLNRDIMIIASNANVGGPTTAASMAIAKGWDDLVGPALLIGSFGYVIGNYLGMVVGFVTSGWL